MTDANKMQVGGTHYNGVQIQHWDLVAANDLRYFEAQITRYVTRWKKKNGSQDVQKALHYLAKLKELLGASVSADVQLGLPPARPVRLLWEFAGQNNLSDKEVLIFFTMLTYTTYAELEIAEKLISQLYDQAVELEKGESK